MKVLMILAAALAVTGCAATSDVENLQGQLNSLSSEVTVAAADAVSAKQAAQSAADKADAASQAASKAETSAKEVNAKLDRLFQKTQYK
jgi:hypothetical protein